MNREGVRSLLTELAWDELVRLAMVDRRMVRILLSLLYDADDEVELEGGVATAARPGVAPPLTRPVAERVLDLLRGLQPYTSTLGPQHFNDAERRGFQVSAQELEVLFRGTSAEHWRQIESGTETSSLLQNLRRSGKFPADYLQARDARQAPAPSVFGSAQPSAPVEAAAANGGPSAAAQEAHRRLEQGEVQEALAVIQGSAAQPRAYDKRGELDTQTTADSLVGEQERLEREIRRAASSTAYPQPPKPEPKASAEEAIETMETIDEYLSDVVGLIDNP